MLVPSRLRGHGASCIIWSFLIQSRLATFHISSECGRTGGAGVHHFGSGVQASDHISGKCLTKSAPKWTIGGGTTHALSEIKSIAPIHIQPARGRFNVPASVSLGMVATIPGQRLSRQAAGSTSQVTSWRLDHWIGMWWSTRMMMIRTEQIPDHQSVGGAVQVMALTMTMVRVKRRHQVVR